VKPLIGPHCREAPLALPENIRLGWKWLTVTTLKLITRARLLYHKKQGVLTEGEGSVQLISLHNFKSAAFNSAKILFLFLQNKLSQPKEVNCTKPSPQKGFLGKKCFMLLSLGWGSAAMKWLSISGNPYWRGKLSTIDLHVKITGFVKKYFFIIKSCWSEPVDIWRSTILILPLQ
jgi:hypothetical protein